MASPLAQRVDPVHPGGGIAVSGVAELRRSFPNPESAKAYSEWANHPITKLVRSALMDMALNGRPLDPDPGSPAVQYGVTLGLGAAAQMLEDASLVIPGMFAPPTPAVNPSDMPATFSVSPQDALDNL